MENLFRKVLKGYATQARWFAAHLEGAQHPSGGYASDWTQLGWTKLGNGAVKPVFRMVACGTPIVLLDGQSHLHRVVSEVPAACVFATEEAARAAQGGW